MFKVENVYIILGLVALCAALFLSSKLAIAMQLGILIASAMCVPVTHIEKIEFSDSKKWAFVFYAENVAVFMTTYLYRIILLF